MIASPLPVALDGGEGGWVRVAFRRRVATAAVLLGLIVAAFEGTVVTSAMPTIARELGGLALYAWVFASFLVASMVGVLVCGKLADGFGRRPVFILGMGVFLAGSALCGAAVTLPQLIAFRVLQGLGAGSIQPIAMTISSDLYTLEERARVQAVFTTGWGAANVLGPLIGGLLVAHLSWRWVFFVNIPFGLAAAALLALSYRDPVRTTRRPLGLGGALLAGASAALSLVALQPPVAVSWPARGALVLGAAAAVGALLRQQARSASPLLTAAALRDPTVRAGLAGALFSGGLLYACAAYVPLFMTETAHSSPLCAGAALVPMLAGWAVGSSFGVRVLVRHGMRASVVGGFLIALAGAAALATAGNLGLPPWMDLAALALLGLGLGPASSTGLVASQNAVDWHERGAVTSAVYSGRMLGGSLAVAFFGAVPPSWTGPAAQFTGVGLLTLAAVVVLGAITPGRPRRHA